MIKTSGNSSEEHLTFLKSVYEGSDLPVFVIGVDEGNNLFFEGINEAHEKVSGMNNEMIAGKSPEELPVPPEAARRVRANYEKCLKAGKTIQYKETLPLNGQETYWFTTLTPLKNQDGKIYRIVGMSMPINDLVETQKELEETKATLEEQVAERTNKLRESEEKHRAVFESATDAFIVADMSGTIVEVNRSACDIYGYSYNEMIGKMVSELIHPDHFHKFPLYLESVEKKKSFRGETVDVRKDGSTFSTEIHGSAIHYNDQTYLLVIIRDVSEKKEFNKRLTKEKEFTDAVINSLPGVFYAFNENGRYIKWNKTLEQITGFSAKELTEISPLDTIAPHHRDKIAKAAETVFEKGSVVVEADYNTVNGVVPYLFNGVKMNARGESLLLGVGIDISQRKEAEKEREKLLKSLNERVKEITCLFEINEVIKNSEAPVPDVLKQVVSAVKNGWQYPENTAVKLMLDQSEYKTRNYRESPDFVEESIIVRNKTRGKIRVIVFDLDEKEAKAPFLEEEKRLLKNICNNVGIYISRVEDEKARRELTERLRVSNEELEQFADVVSTKNEKLEESNAAKNLMISIISHDLRGPINSIIGLLGIVHSEYDSIDSTTQKQYLKSILSSTKNTRNLMENLLQWASIQSNRQKVKPEPADVQELIEEGMRPLQTLASEKKIELTVDIQHNIEVEADKTMITTVIRNLVSNALKFTPHSGRIKISAEPTTNSDAVIYIEDSGIGMGEETLKTLFEAGKTASSKGTGGELGSGFGLILCKEFVEKNNGTLKIESEKGKGTKVSFNLRAVN